MEAGGSWDWIRRCSSEVRAAILREPGKIVVEDIPEPEPGEGEVVIKVRYALTDGTDLKAYLRGHHLIGYGPFGHEYSGTVAKVGKGVKNFQEGDDVMGVNTAPCMECHFCRREMYSLCEKLTDNMVLGTYAEYVRIPARVVKTNLFHKPEDISFKVAPILEPLACVVRGVENLGEIRPGSRILIVGTGSVAIMFALLLKDMGEIYVAGRRTEALHRTENLTGARTLLMDNGFMEKALDITGGYGFDIIIDATGSTEAMQRTLKLLSRGGKFMVFSGVERGATLSVDIHALHYGEMTVVGSFHHTPDSVRRALEILRGKHRELESLITHELPLEEIEEAFRLMMERKALKVAIRP